MILKRLIEYWEREGDSLPSGYQPAFLTKRISLDKDGKLIEVIALTGEKRGTREGKTYVVPREQPRRSSGVRPRLIHDNAQYVLGLEGDKDNPKRVAQSHHEYVALVKECAEKTKEPTVQVLANWLVNGGPEKLTKSHEIDPSMDDFFLEVNGINPADLPSVRAFWSAPAEGERGLCSITGIETVIVDRMPIPIKGIPGGQPSGTARVSVNNPSGESFGLKAALNSPIGQVPAEAIGNALNRLLSDSSHHLRVGETVFLAWTKKPTEFSFFDLVKQPSAEQAKNLIAAVSESLSRQAGLEGGAAWRKPEAMQAVSDDDFYVLALSANMSRAVVRDYHETTLPNAKRALALWYLKLGIQGMDGQDITPPGIFQLAVSLYREAKDIPKHVPVSLLRTALTGVTLPSLLLALAVRRNVVMRGPYDEMNKKRRLSYPRIALIKAVLTPNPKEDNQLSALNEKHPDAAYH
ncbi:MAG: type I-C CRISPR-associated protein Cas8c/Csd1, partial [bacterium]